jgi:hypothetical protein
VTVDLRCSTWARENDIDPIGTVGSYGGYLLVPWPLPWPRDIADIDALGPVATRAKQLGYRLQAIVPSDEGETAVRCYHWRSDHGRFFGRCAAGTSDIAMTALQLMEGEEPSNATDVQGIDVIICGHGRRDRCCGSMGTSLQTAVARVGILGQGVRVFRTSHTGGHRFAPTAILFPEGTGWGYLDEQILRRIVNHSSDLRGDLSRYRGCAGLPSPKIQALERAVLAEVGWELFNLRRWGTELADDVVRMMVTNPGHRDRLFEAKVTVKRRVPVPECGVGVGDDKKTEDELSVAQFRQIDEAGEPDAWAHHF